MTTDDTTLSAVTPDDAVFWFRRDLRLHDNAGLFNALRENPQVLPIFIFDRQILGELEDRHDRRMEFIHNAVTELKVSLEKLGSSLLVLTGNPVDLFGRMNARVVYTNHDYEPYASERDQKVMSILQSKSISFKTFKDQVIFEKDEVMKDDGAPYTIFTPYSKRWKQKLTGFYLKQFPVGKYFQHLKKVSPLEFPSLEQIGFAKTNTIFPDKHLDERLLKQYDRTRNFPAIKKGTSRLSVHLRFGTVSIRELVPIALRSSETWLNELIWREFFQMILWHFPHVVSKSFKSAYDNIEWQNNEREFEKWCNGTTGFPLVDAGMRELNKTAFMHNRVRMVVASFLVKHLLIDWRWGEAYFAQKLLDYDLAANNGNWQWAAGCGCDAAPYFRVFNPTLQASKFDQQNEYIKQWVPEFGTPDYPKPMVEHRMAQQRAIAAYQQALKPWLKPVV